MAFRPSALPSKPSGRVSRFPAERLGDAELVQAALSGDADAVAVIWDRHAGLVRGLLRAALGPDLVVEDLVREAFLAVIRSTKETKDGAALRSMLVRAAVELATVELRRRRLRRWLTLSNDVSLPDSALLPGDAGERQALATLYRALDALGSRRRLAFVLRYFQGMGFTELASALQVSELKARRELARASARVLASAYREPALHGYLQRFAGEAT